MGYQLIKEAKALEDSTASHISIWDITSRLRMQRFSSVCAFLTAGLIGREISTSVLMMCGLMRRDLRRKRRGAGRPSVSLPRHDGIITSE